MTRSKLAIITALKEEQSAIAAALKGEPVRVLRAGVGSAAAAALTRELIHSEAPTLLCFSGFCGGLDDSLSVGDVLLSTELKSATSKTVHRVDPGFPLSEMTAVLSSAKIPHQLGTILTVSDPVFLADQKRKLGKEHQAIGVDMESFAVAETAGSATKVFALRTVSDSVDDELPREVGEFLDANGDVCFGRVARFVLSNPFNIRTLMGLKKRSDLAAARLSAAWRVIWPVIDRLVP